MSSGEPSTWGESIPSGESTPAASNSGESIPSEFARGESLLRYTLPADGVPRVFVVRGRCLRHFLCVQDPRAFASLVLHLTIPIDLDEYGTPQKKRIPPVSDCILDLLPPAFPLSMALSNTESSNDDFIVRVPREPPLEVALAERYHICPIRTWPATGFTILLEPYLWDGYGELEVVIFEKKKVGIDKVGLSVYFGATQFDDGAPRQDDDGCYSFSEPLDMEYYHSVVQWRHRSLTVMKL